MYPARGLLGWPVLSSSRTYYYGFIHRPGRFTRHLRRLALFIMLLTSAIAGMNLLLNGLVKYEPAVLSATISPNVSAQEQTPPQPAPAITSTIPTSDNQLQTILNNWASGHRDHRWSVAVQGLAGDTRMASLSAGTVYASASIYKLQLLYPLLQTIPIVDWDRVNLNLSGQNTTVRDCVEKMLKFSDNPCGEAVAARVGLAKADRLLKQLGLTSTKLNNPAGARTSAADVSIYLKSLYDSKFLDNSTRQYIMGLMQQQVWRKGVPAGCSGCIVSDKTGDLGDVRHDAAIIEHHSGAYILTIFTDGASYGQIAELTRQVQSYMSQSSP